MRRYARLKVRASITILALAIFLVAPCEARIIYTQTTQTISGPDQTPAVDFNHDAYRTIAGKLTTAGHT